jgi:hypothetical protein
MASSVAPVANEVKVAPPIVTLNGKVAIVTGSSRYVSHHLSISI